MWQVGLDNLEEGSEAGRPVSGPGCGRVGSGPGHPLAELGLLLQGVCESAVDQGTHLVSWASCSRTTAGGALHNSRWDGVGQESPLGWVVQLWVFPLFSTMVS